MLVILTSGSLEALWNILYDGFLRMKLPEGARYLAFTDDIAIARGTDTIQFERILALSREETISWLQRSGLQLAIQKMETMVISNVHLHSEMNIQYKMHCQS